MPELLCRASIGPLAQPAGPARGCRCCRLPVATPVVCHGSVRDDGPAVVGGFVLHFVIAAVVEVCANSERHIAKQGGYGIRHLPSAREASEGDGQP